MKIMLLAIVAMLSIPAAAFAQETAAECCCKTGEQAAEGCCPEGAHAEDADAGHSH